MLTAHARPRRPCRRTRRVVLEAPPSARRRSGAAPVRAPAWSLGDASRRARLPRGRARPAPTLAAIPLVAALGHLCSAGVRRPRGWTRRYGRACGRYRPGLTDSLRSQLSRRRPVGCSACNRAKDRGPVRGSLRPRLPHPRAAGRARAQARQGDGRPPDGLRLARLRPERVHALPFADRPRAVRTATSARCSASSSSTCASTRAGRSYALLSRPKVLMETDADLSMGEFGIATRIAQRRGRAARSREPEPESSPGATMVYKPQSPPEPRRSTRAEMDVERRSRR